MNYLVLIGILIVIVGFALKVDSILTIMVAMLVTALLGGIDIVSFLEILGTNFVSSRNMAIFVLIMLVTGTLERNGLREAAAKLISKVKNATPGIILSIYGVMRAIFGAFNVSFGGVAGFVAPVIMPMEIASIEAKELKPNEEHVEELKGMTSAMENISWFFTQVLFIGGSGALLVQETIKNLDYQEPELVNLAAVEIPVAIFAVLFSIVFFLIKDERLIKKLYPQKGENK